LRKKQEENAIKKVEKMNYLQNQVDINKVLKTKRENPQYHIYDKIYVRRDESGYFNGYLRYQKDLNVYEQLSNVNNNKKS